VLLYATTEATRKRLKKLFAERKIEKQYYAITNGVPSTREGIVNIPISMGKLEDRYRQTLRPDYDASKGTGSGCISVEKMFILPR
jgi:23S rRNA-/tRNA-specific pseudouridylate synthase